MNIMNKTSKLAIISVLTITVFVGAAIYGYTSMVPAVSAAGSSDRVSDLGELIVLDGLFDARNGDRSGRISDLGELIVLDNLFDANGNGSGRISDLGELIVLDNLFDGDNGDSRVSDLGELIVLDNLFD